MRPCPRRLCRLDQTVRGLLLLAVLIFFLFTLPSFIKEPNTKPSRNEHQQNIKERSLELLQNATSQAPTPRRRATTHVESVQGTRTRDTHPKATTLTADQRRRVQTSKARAEEPGRVPTPIGKAAPQTQASKDTRADTLPPMAGGGGVASSRTEAPSLNSQNPRMTKGSGDRKARPTGPRAVPTKLRDSPATAAKTLLPKHRAGAQTPGGGGQEGKRARGASPAAAPSQDRAQPTRSSAPLQSPATQRSQKLKATNFKSEPQWDFEEEYSLEVGGLQTTCPDSVKIKASKSPWLQTLFLPNLTLFLDSGHFNQSEWDRLEHFAPPFGFMELNFSLVQKVVARFPPVPQQQLLLASLPTGSSQCISCAVVGNGGILNNSHVGPEIDSHDYVFRLSGAIIKGYEHDVGTRTSFYGFTAFSLTQSLLILGSRGFPHAPLGQVSKEERVWPPTDFGYGRMQVRQGDGQGDREHSESRACCRYSLRACEGQGRGGQPCQTGGEQAGGLGSKSGHPTEGRTPGPHTVLGPQDVRYLHFLEGTRDYEWLEALLLNRTLTSRNLSWFRRRPQEAFQEALQLDRYLLLHPDLLRYMKNRFLRSKTLNTAHWRIYRPTTGALLLLTALQLCDQVSAYGFITEGHERFSDHYYDKSWKRTIFYTNHDFKLERALWKRLHDEGIIRLYQRPITSKPTI
ncbi:alpha-N-acetylgalactosaminide alpha-2,6-sialyltransferase 1 isoform X1 [Bos taurus]|uniref:alpha-N-acetylgalactosaminide alpha-2,6-sialyltransferase 1 isoform X1 n=1 Tax=Bos taurus TaxID=9913 RepID=UPI000D537062|nr:alpha-N-acetylgalactosaminide alpha-2,6-sialyltransferase 1 isoform X1 [Bos taurus]XP_010814912.2 alpha-N-acetylgalactosaminide alpha-2,6-sialyltransferase 1 isoform X1 [Bos taurus]XP_015314487.2 alpha-N-acetylgalactosaminide alpha-2,6-sialyltransferase 1 isoform X1 [Bos taurus]